jgi:hypothetical protein
MLVAFGCGRERRITPRLGGDKPGRDEHLIQKGEQNRSGRL